MDIRKKPKNKDNDSKEVTNLKYVAPGLWVAMHFMAARIDGVKKGEEFKAYLELLKNTLPCVYCRQHMSDYLETHPLPSKYSSFFEWSVNFHNDVNRRLGYKQMPMEKAISLYMGDEGVCSDDCDESIKPDNVTIIQEPVTKRMDSNDTVFVPKPSGKPSFRIVSIY